jgi:hypothetical protein
VRAIFPVVSDAFPNGNDGDDMVEAAAQRIDAAHGKWLRRPDASGHRLLVGAGDFGALGPLGGEDLKLHREVGLPGDRQRHGKASGDGDGIGG